MQFNVFVTHIQPVDMKDSSTGEIIDGVKLFGIMGNGSAWDGFFRGVEDKDRLPVHRVYRIINRYQNKKLYPTGFKLMDTQLEFDFSDIDEVTV